MLNAMEKMISSVWFQNIFGACFDIFCVSTFLCFNISVCMIHRNVWPEWQSGLGCGDVMMGSITERSEVRGESPADN